MRFLGWLKEKWNIIVINDILKNAEKEGKKIYITADQHFFHGNIIRYCNRPFRNYREMNEFMIRRWNEIVKKDDIVIHLGDFAFKNKVNLIRPRLNGTIILIRGNHDRYVKESDGFRIIEKNLIVDNLILSHRPLPKEEIPSGMINVFGHIHQHHAYSGKCVCVEQTDYKPILLSSISNKV